MNKDYPYLRNGILRKYVQPPHHLNWIRLDGNSDIRHMRKVCDICLKLKENQMDFLTRPTIEIAPIWIKKKDEWKPIRKYGVFIPDILTFIHNPFKPVIIEVINSEKKEHAENKNYPSEFKVVSVSVDSELEGLL